MRVHVCSQPARPIKRDKTKFQYFVPHPFLGGDAMVLKKKTVPGEFLQTNFTTVHF